MSQCPYSTPTTSRLLSTLSFVLLLMLSSACKSLEQKARDYEAKGIHYEAGRLYQRLYQKTSTADSVRRGLYAYKSAEQSLALRNISKALSQYRQAERYRYKHPLLSYRLGYTLQATGDYEAAHTYYAKVDTTDRASSIYLVGIGGCAMSANAPQVDSLSTLYQLPISQTTYSDYAPTLSPSGTSLIFLSRRGKQKANPATGEGYSRIYQLNKRQDGSWQETIDTLRGSANSPYDEYSPTVSADGESLYYIAHTPRGKKLYKSERLSDGSWSRSEEINLWGESEDKPLIIEELTLSPEGNKLYFTSRRDSLRGKDIYYSERLSNKGWSQPIALPSAINSLGDEASPYLAEDGTLYFASDGHIGYGGYDIYRAKQTATGWQVEHLPKPINSPSDEFSYIPDPRRQVGDEYFAERAIIASNRGDARGRSHLYEYRRKSTEGRLEGFVSDREGNPLVGAMIRVVARGGSGKEELVLSRADGSFVIKIKPNESYVLHASCTGYLNQFARFTTGSEDVRSVFSLDFSLTSRVRPERIEGLLYTFGSSELSAESEPTLNELYRLLTDNPEIRLRLTAHTDRIGDADYNQALSLRRSEHLVERLVALGIERKRLLALGAGKTKPYIVSHAMSQRYPKLKEGQVLSEDFIATLTDDSLVALADSLNRRTELEVIED